MDDLNLPDPRTTIGALSEKTKRNIAQAKAYGAWAGPYHIEWKFWTGNFIVWPKPQAMTTEFFHEGPVRWWRCYWLTIGLSIYKLLPERRHENLEHLGWSDRRGRKL